MAYRQSFEITMEVTILLPKKFALRGLPNTGI